MKNLTQEQVDARELAVSYHAYREAIRAEDWSGVEIWGRLLLQAQKDTGVTLSEPCTIKGMMQLATSKQ